MLLGKNKPLDPNKDEQYTPKAIFDKLAVEFDLDVCSPVLHQDHVPARKRYTIHDDGLAQNWEGFVWMNPPYSHAKVWVEKFMEHGNGIALLPFSKAYWMVEIWNRSSGVCPVYDIKFEQKEGKAKGIFMPVALFSMGEKGLEVIQAAKINKVR
jgi:hypothetical protein